MRRFGAESDQLYNWPDRFEESSNNLAPTARASDPAPTVVEARVLARLFGRAVQEMRQAWLQMCTRTRSWSEVLLIGELSRTAPGDDLRAAGQRQPSQAIPCKPNGCPRAFGGDLRSQPRTLETTGRLLGVDSGFEVHPSLGVYRSVYSWRCGGQHDSGFPAVSRETGRSGR